MNDKEKPLYGPGDLNGTSLPEPGDQMEVQMSAEPAQVGETAGREELPGVAGQDHVDEELLRRSFLQTIMRIININN